MQVQLDRRSHAQHASAIPNRQGKRRCPEAFIITRIQEARRRLLDSGVLDRFEDKSGPNVVVEAG
jgi:hypothetical protein